MKDIFRFEIADKLKLHKDNQINIEVSIVANNLKYYAKELEKLIPLYKKIEAPLLKQANILNKGKFHKNKARLEESFSEVKMIFDKTNNLIFKLFPERKNLFYKDYIKFIEEIKESEENFFENSQDKISNYYYKYLSIIEKKYTMCSKLSKLENKPLRAIVTFSRGDYYTHFTKYHLNLEEFSDEMHSILKTEFDRKYMKDYRDLEKKHFELLDNKMDNNLMTVKDFLLFSDKVMSNYSKIKKYPENFLKAQMDTFTINQDIEQMIELYSKIEEKFDKIYTKLKESLKNNYEKKDINVLFIRCLVLMYEFKLKDFVLQNTENVAKMIDFLKEKEGIENEIDYISLTNFMRIEPSLADKVLKTVLGTIKDRKDFSKLDSDNQFLIKKATKNLFDNNQFYSHQIMFYSILPEEITIKSNKYMQNSGYDKVFVENNVLRYKDQVFSHLLNKKISYEFYIKTALYYVNVNNNLERIA